MLGHWYSLLLLRPATPETAISAHGVEKRQAKKPKRGKFEVDSFSGFPARQVIRNDDEECLLLLLI